QHQRQRRAPARRRRRPGRHHGRRGRPTRSMTTDSGVVGGETVEAIAAAVLASPAVARLHGGRFNTVASYLPGRRFVGVAVTPSEITVGVVGHYPNTVAQ